MLNRFLAGLLAASGLLAQATHDFSTDQKVIPYTRLGYLPGVCSVGQLLQVTNQPVIYRCDDAGNWNQLAWEVGTILPSTCALGQVFFNSSTSAGQNLYLCTAPSVWTQLIGATGNGTCQGGGGAPANCAPSFDTVTLTNSNQTATATVASATMDVLSFTLAANVTSYVINSLLPNQLVMMNITQPAGQAYTVASPSGFPTVAVCPNDSSSVAKVTTTVYQMNSTATAAKFISGSVNIGTGCFPEQAAPTEVPPSGFQFCWNDSTSHTQECEDSNGNIYRMVNSSSLNTSNQVTFPGLASPPFVTNAQTSTYQVIASDFTQCKTISVASGTFTITLVASGSQPPSGQCITIINYGTGVVTVARSGQNLNGGTANLTIGAGSATAPTGAHVVSDGTNYEMALWTPPAAASQVYKFGGSFGFPGSGTALASTPGTGAYMYSTPAPAACTIQNWSILVDAGTATVKFVKVASGTALPTVGSNSISTSGVAISSGTVVDRSSTLTDFTTTAVSQGDVIGVYLSAVASADFLAAEFECK